MTEHRAAAVSSSASPLCVRRASRAPPPPLAATRWLQVSYDVHHVLRQGRITRDVDIQNVVAILPGKSPRK